MLNNPGSAHELLVQFKTFLPSQQLTIFHSTRQFTGGLQSPLCGTISIPGGSRRIENLTDLFLAKVGLQLHTQ
jgi:hypothetical protein